MEAGVAVISGGGTGIGAATARRFAAEGASVVVTGRRRAPLEEVAAVERFGGVHVVVAGAGGHGMGTVLATTGEDWREAVDTNLTSAFVPLREALPHLIERRGAVNAICPGWVRTPMADSQMDELAAARAITREEAYALAASQVPLRRPPSPRRSRRQRRRPPYPGLRPSPSEQASPARLRTAAMVKARS